MRVLKKQTEQNNLKKEKNKDYVTVDRKIQEKVKKVQGQNRRIFNEKIFIKVSFPIQKQTIFMNGRLYIKQQKLGSKGKTVYPQSDPKNGRQFRSKLFQQLKRAFDHYCNNTHTYFQVTPQFQNSSHERTLQISLSQQKIDKEEFQFLSKSDNLIINIPLNVKEFKKICRQVFQFWINDNLSEHQTHEIIRKVVKDQNFALLLKKQIMDSLLEVGHRKRLYLNQQFDKTMDSQVSYLGQTTTIEITEKLQHFFIHRTFQFIPKILAYNFVLLCYEYQKIRPYSVNEEIFKNTVIQQSYPQKVHKRIKFFELSQTLPRMIIQLLNDCLVTIHQKTQLEMVISQQQCVNLKVLQRLFSDEYVQRFPQKKYSLPQVILDLNKQAKHIANYFVNFVEYSSSCLKDFMVEENEAMKGVCQFSKCMLFVLGHELIKQYQIKLKQDIMKGYGRVCMQDVIVHIKNSQKWSKVQTFFVDNLHKCHKDIELFLAKSQGLLKLSEQTKQPYCSIKKAYYVLDELPSLMSLYRQLSKRPSHQLFSDDQVYNEDRFKEIFVQFIDYLKSQYLNLYYLQSILNQLCKEHDYPQMTIQRLLLISKISTKQSKLINLKLVVQKFCMVLVQMCRMHCILSSMPFYSYIQSTQRKNIDQNKKTSFKKIGSKREFIENLDAIFSWKNNEITTQLLNLNLNNVEEVFNHFVDIEIVLKQLILTKNVNIKEVLGPTTNEEYEKLSLQSIHSQFICIFSIEEYKQVIQPLLKQAFYTLPSRLQSLSKKLQKSRSLNNLLFETNKQEQIKEQSPTVKKKIFALQTELLQKLKKVLFSLLIQLKNV